MMETLTFALVLRNMAALPRILFLCQRLGGTVTRLTASEDKADLVMAAPRQAAHRFAPQLQRIIDVVAVTEMHAKKTSESVSTAAAALRKTA